MSEWKEYEVEHLIKKRILSIGDGYRAKNSELSDRGIPFARAGNLNSGFDFSNCDYFPKEDLWKVGEKKSQVGDVVFTSKGTVGRFAFVNENTPEFVFSPQLCYWRSLDESVIYPRFLYYWMQSRAFTAQVYAVKGQTDMADYVSLRDQRQMSVTLPEIITQKEIASVFSDLDQKITLLRHQNQTLEKIAQTLFKHWFVDFEFPCLPSDYVLGAGKPGIEELNKTCTYRAVGGLPAPLGKSGLPAPQPGKHFIYVLLCENGSFYIGLTDDLYRRWHEHKTGQGAKWTKANPPLKVVHYEEFTSRSEAAEREKWLKTGFGRKWLKREFKAGRLRQAGKMVASALGEVPVGWEWLEIQNLIEVKDGTHDSPKQSENGFPLVTSKHLNGNSIDIRNAYLISESDYNEINKRSKVDRHDILLSMIGTVGVLYYVLNEKVEFAIKNIGLFKSSQKGELSEYIFLFLKSSYGRIYFKAHISGTTQSYLTLGSLRELPLLIPGKEILEKILPFFKTTYSKIYNNSKEIQTLTQTRDTLLPKLMSGQLKVKE